MINGYSVYSIVVTLLVCIFGFIVTYLKSKQNLLKKAGEFINKAEEDYASVSKAGQEKFNWVVATLHSLLPAPMRLFISEQVISEIVQRVFDSMAEFATKQLDKVVEDIVE